MDRDRAVESLLRAHPLRASGDCLEPEVLAAWVDGGLTDREVARAEAHVADCSRCQALLATMANSPQPAPARAPWWRRAWGFPILVPLTAGAAAIALWIASPAYQSGLSQSRTPEQTQAQSAESSQSAAVDRVQSAPPAVNEERKETEQPQQPARQQNKDERERSDALRDNVIGRLEKADAKARALSAQDAIAAEPQKLPAAPVESPAGANATAAVAAPPPPPAATPSPLAETITVLRGFGVAQRPPGSTDIVSPNSAVRWRIGPAGSMERSTDSGATWQPLASGVSADLIAGVSPAASVCWVVGRLGTVLLTTDGLRWQRLAFPEPVDLTSVQASDARSATVTASDGRVFRSADGGTTWSLLQDF